MKVTVIPVVIGALGTIPKGLVKGLEHLEKKGQVETIMTTTLLRSAKILRRDLETCCHSDSCEKPSANAHVKNSQWNNNNDNKNNNNNITWIIDCLKMYKISGEVIKFIENTMKKVMKFIENTMEN